MDPEKKLKEDVVEQPSTCSELSLSTVAADTENDIVQGELSEYECQYLGFTPKSLINGGKIDQTCSFIWSVNIRNILVGMYVIGNM